MNLKKLFALALVGALAAMALLVGCSSNSGSSSAASSSASASGSSAASTAAEESIVIGCSYIAGNLDPVDSAWDLTAHGISEGVYM